MLSDVEIQILIRILLSVLMGLCIGLERELSHKTAGMKTHALVCLGSTIFTVLSIYGFNYSDQSLKISHDPARIAAQIITGIGFIGGGAVLHAGMSVKGITTAATLWLTAAIGMCLGCGLYLIGLFSVIITISMLLITKIIESKVLYNKVGYHCTTEKKLEKYRISGCIMPPVRFFPNEQTARRWMLRTGRDILLEIKVSESWPLPDHKPARWTDEYIRNWKILQNCPPNKDISVNSIEKSKKDIDG